MIDSETAGFIVAVGYQLGEAKALLERWLSTKNGTPELADHTRAWLDRLEEELA